MKRSVLWAESAIEELDKAIAYIAERNPAAARKVYGEIHKAGDDLGIRANFDVACGVAREVDVTRQGPVIQARGLACPEEGPVTDVEIASRAT